MTSTGAETSSPRAAAAQLCVSCGFCCNNLFFGFVELKPEDDPTALGALLPIERKADKLILRQPCAALDGCRCTIYDRRPQICRGYRCQVLREVEKTPGALPPALEQVARLSAHFEMLKTQLRQAGYLAPDMVVSAGIKAFRMAYQTALTTTDTPFFMRHRELILRWKKTAWLIQQFDQWAAAAFTLPAHPLPVQDA